MTWRFGIVLLLIVLCVWPVAAQDEEVLIDEEGVSEDLVTEESGAEWVEDANEWLREWEAGAEALPLDESVGTPVPFPTSTPPRPTATSRPTQTAGPSPTRASNVTWLPRGAPSDVTWLPRGAPSDVTWIPQVVPATPTAQPGTVRGSCQGRGEASIRPQTGYVGQDLDYRAAGFVPYSGVDIYVQGPDPDGIYIPGYRLAGGDCMIDGIIGISSLARPGRYTVEFAGTRNLDGAPMRVTAQFDVQRIPTATRPIGPRVPGGLP